MANHDGRFILIAPGVIKTVDGKEYGVHDAQSVLAPSRWAEYQRLFKAVGMNEGLNRNEKTGDVFLAAHTLGKTEAVATYFGYLYCTNTGGRPYSFPPCMEGSDSAGGGGTDGGSLILHGTSMKSEYTAQTTNVGIAAKGYAEC